MLSNNFNTNLLGIKDISVEFIKETENEIHIEIETEAKTSICPCCKHETKYVYDYRTQKIKDLSFRGKFVYLVLKKRRYICKNCGKRFYEKYSFLPRYHRMTQRVYESIIHLMRESYSMKSISKMFNVSTNTVSRVFDIVNYKLYKLPKIIAIDEFKGNAGNQKYQAILTNPDKRKVLDIMPTRERTHLIDYFKQFSGRDNVEIVVMDMWEPYYDMCKWMFPKAKIIIDKYHYVRQVYWALDRVRKRIQKKFEKEKRIYFKHSKKLLFARYDKLDYENKQALSIMISQHDDLYSAWLLKELFISFRECKNSKDGRKLLRDWILTAQEANIPEFNDCIKAFTNWFDQILNSLDYPYTNGFTEGTNNKIKVLKRNAYGYRNFERFRNRILHCCA
jgi:transposase